MIIAIEGIDGAGKNTLVRAIRERVDADVLAFPRYDVSAPAQLVQEALHGRMGDLTDSAYAMATLFALDRHGARGQLERDKQFVGAIIEGADVLKEILRGGLERLDEAARRAAT